MPILEEIVARLEKRFDCHSFILYGSRATADFDQTSDYDICGFRDQGECVRDCEHWQGIWLDAWIYSIDKIEKPNELLHIRRGVVLKERDKFATNCLELANKAFNQGPTKLAEWELRSRRVWIKKNLLRIERNDIEGNFRRHWLLYSVLEYYFDFRGQWYLGPKESFKWLQVNDLESYVAFEQALRPDASSGDIRRVAQLVMVD